MSHHKKRKFSEEEGDRNLHHVFAAAAKAVTALYSSAEREQKKARLHSRQLLERQFQWVLRESSQGVNDTISTRALLNYLQQEAQLIEQQEGAAPAAQAAVPPPQRQLASAFGAFANKPFQEDDEQPCFPQSRESPASDGPCIV